MNQGKKDQNEIKTKNTILTQPPRELTQEEKEFFRPNNLPLDFPFPNAKRIQQSQKGEANPHCQPRQGVQSATRYPPSNASTMQCLSHRKRYT